MSKFIELNGRTYDANAVQQLLAEQDLLIAEQNRVAALLQAQQKEIILLKRARDAVTLEADTAIDLATPYLDVAMASLHDGAASVMREILGQLVRARNSDQNKDEWIDTAWQALCAAGIVADGNKTLGDAIQELAQHARA